MLPESEMVFKANHRSRIDFRRMVIYCVIGWFILVFLKLGRWFEIPLNQIVNAILAILAFAISLYTFESYRLILNEDGIRQRNLFRWQKWTWKELATPEVNWDWESNTVIRLHAKTKADRELNLRLLSKNDAKTIRKFLFSIVHKPKPPIPAAEYHLNLLGMHIHLNQEFLIRSSIWTTSVSTIPWHEVNAVIWRLSHDYHDYVKMELRAAGLPRPIRFAFKNQWNGANPVELAEFIVRQLPAKSVLIVSAYDSPRTKLEYDVRLKDLTNSWKEHRWQFCVMSIMWQSIWLMIISRNLRFWLWNEAFWIYQGVTLIMFQLPAILAYLDYKKDKKTHLEKLQELIQSAPAFAHNPSNNGNSA